METPKVRKAKRVTNPKSRTNLIRRENQRRVRVEVRSRTKKATNLTRKEKMMMMARRNRKREARTLNHHTCQRNQVVIQQLLRQMLLLHLHRIIQHKDHRQRHLRHHQQVPLIFLQQVHPWSRQKHPHQIHPIILHRSLRVFHLQHPLRCQVMFHRMYPRSYHLILQVNHQV